LKKKPSNHDAIRKAREEISFLPKIDTMGHCVPVLSRESGGVLLQE
jgi:hypothetical protein